MKATLLPLQGKYYGTEIQLESPDGEITTLVVGLRGDGTPSDRELQSSLGCSRQDYDENRAIVYSDWYGDEAPTPAQEAWSMYCCDGHYETQASHLAALEIVAAL